MCFRPDQQHVLHASGLDHARRDAQPVDEAAALVADVEGGDEGRAVALGEPEPILEVHRGPREVAVGRQRRQDDEIDVLLVEPGALDGHLRRGLGEVTREHALVGETTFLDAGAGTDPLVRGVDAVLGCELVVGDHSRRNVEAGPRDVGVGHSPTLPPSMGRAHRRHSAGSGSGIENRCFGDVVVLDGGPLKGGEVLLCASARWCCKTSSCLAIAAASA